MFVVTVRFTVRAGHEAEFLTAVRAQSRNSLAREPACVRFDVCVDAAQPQDIFLYEVYASAAAFDEHQLTPHFAQFGSLTQDWVEEKTVDTWTLAED